MVQNTSFDPFNTNCVIAGFVAQNSLNTIGKNYVMNSNSPNFIQYNILATIPFSILHDIFNKIPLIKNMYFRLVLNLNANFTSQLTISNATVAGINYSALTTISNANTCPFMVSPLSTANSVTAASATNSQGLDVAASCTGINCNLSIGSYSYNGVVYKNNVMSTCRIYACQYTLSPINEEKYLSSNPIKTILYDDFFYYNQGLLNIPPGSFVNPTLTSGQSRLRGLLIVPQISASVHGSTIAGLQNGVYAGGVGQLGSPLLSPFSSAPGSCAPFAKITNLNVTLGTSTIYQQNLNYGCEQYDF
jgi:hypothetical protein